MTAHFRLLILQFSLTDSLCSMANSDNKRGRYINLPGDNPPSRGRSPWRERRHRTDWPSIWCPNAPSYSRDRPRPGTDGSSRAYGPSSVLAACPFWRFYRRRRLLCLEIQPEKEDTTMNTTLAAKKKRSHCRNNVNLQLCENKMRPKCSFSDNFIIFMC